LGCGFGQAHSEGKESFPLSELKLAWSYLGTNAAINGRSTTVVLEPRDFPAACLFFWPDREQLLVVLDGLAIFHKRLDDFARDVGLNFIH